MSQVTPSPRPGQEAHVSRQTLKIPVALRRTLWGVIAGLIVVNVVLKVNPGLLLPALRTVTDRNHRFEIAIPAHWTVRENNGFDLFAAGEYAEQLVLEISSEPKALDGELGPAHAHLEGYSDANFNKLRSSLADGSQTQPHGFSLNGLPAVQVEIAGNHHGIQRTFLYTVVEGPTHYYHIVLFTLTPRLPEVRPKMDEIVTSFRLRAGPKP
jgi:hypothetical protein